MGIDPLLHGCTHSAEEGCLRIALFPSLLLSAAAPPPFAGRIVGPQRRPLDVVAIRCFSIRVQNPTHDSVITELVRDLTKELANAVEKKTLA